jgi:hypothetical protein
MPETVEFELRETNLGFFADTMFVRTPYMIGSHTFLFFDPELSINLDINERQNKELFAKSPK